MKKIICGSMLLLLLVWPIEEAISQSARQTPAYHRSPEENEKWLSLLKSADKGKQVDMIIDRLITTSPDLDSTGKKCCYPALIVDGILVSTANQLSDSIAVELSTFFNQENIKEIAVLDKVSETVFCSPTFSGAVLLTLKNKRINKQFKSLISAK